MFEEARVMPCLFLTTAVITIMMAMIKAFFFLHLAKTNQRKHVSAAKGFYQTLILIRLGFLRVVFFEGRSI